MKNPAIQTWLARDPDPETRQELETLIRADNETELAHRFAGRLSFGTAGLRGILGAGPNRMNRLVVRETTAGLGQYVLEALPDAADRGVVVSFDGRHGSKAFAHDATAVLLALGFRVYLFDRPAPTPLCAFGVRHLGTAAGVMVTASHNPPQYNGYKVYWQGGAQIIPPHDKNIAAAIDAAAQAPLPWAELTPARGEGRLVELGDALTEAYLQGVADLSIHAPGPARQTLSLAYTALHGVGAPWARAALQRAGFGRVFSVAEQEAPDGSFPTVTFPNPEEPAAMARVLALAEQHHADLAMANDPDADRLAVAIRDPQGALVQLNGDQIGALLGDDRLRNAPDHAVVGTTIVSSRLLSVMAHARHVTCFETLTGLKWIADAANRAEADGGHFIFGYEEAIGFTLGNLVRDKDGISALVALAELAAHCADAGTTLWGRLAEIYCEHGLYLTQLRTLALDPFQKGPTVPDRLRANPPRAIGDYPVVAVTDLLTGQTTRANGTQTPATLPTSNVLVFTLADAARVVVRPSGTEPKLKCYYEIRGQIDAAEPLGPALARTREQLEALIIAHQREIRSLAD